MTVDIICADAREGLARFPDGHFHCCVTSPPYWSLRDFGLGSDSLGLEPTLELYVEHLVSVMREVRRVLRDDGTLWLNLGDSYASSSGTGHGGWDGNNKNPNGTPRQNRQAGDTWMRTPTAVSGLKPKDLVGIPWMVAFALRAAGWWLRSDIIWSKPNPMPESVTDRPTRSHEYLFLLTKRERYYMDMEAIREPVSEGTESRYQYAFKEPRSAHFRHGAGFLESEAGAISAARGRNRRSVWEIATQPFGLEMCGSCRMIYEPAQYRKLRGGSNPRCNHEVVEGEPCGGTNWLPHDGGAMCGACETFYTANQLTRLPRAAKCRRCGSEEWLSHFATFPEKLVEPCILAGTSEWGCCPECGAPWERVVEREYRSPLIKGSKAYEPDTWKGTRANPRKRAADGTFLPRDTLRPQLAARESVTRMGDGVDVSTTGWRPTCKHGAEPVPCRVLDPFAGSGTVGLVAERLGRHSVLIEIKEEYCEMARHRTAQMGLMSSRRE